MNHLTPVSSRKSLLLDEEASSDGSTSCNTKPTKRQRTLSSCTTTSSTPRLLTPPASAKGRTSRPLKLVIPKQQISLEQKRKLNRHKADAKRWEPKLQRPFPTTSEIKRAYPLKLLRHYHAATAQDQPSLVRPETSKSGRVSRLLEQFPLMDTAPPARGKTAIPLDQAVPLSAHMLELRKAKETHLELQTNMYLTRTTYAQRLAWHSFSQTERDRVDRGREAMLQSGLPADDLRLEASGQHNRLPEWRKPLTGWFAWEHRRWRAG